MGFGLQKAAEALVASGRLSISSVNRHLSSAGLKEASQVSEPLVKFNYEEDTPPTLLKWSASSWDV
eukprot:3521594-Rhodomonas_salina.1